MVTYIIVGIASGFLFGTLDGLINANPCARRLHEVYKPIARESINMPAGIVIDLAYGLIMAGIFLLLYPSLPGNSGIIKGISFAILAWFFRVVMYAATQWMTLKIPFKLVIYTLVTGLGEMLVLGLLFGLALKPPV